MEKIYYTLSQANDNQIGTIEVLKPEQLKPLIEKACSPHFCEDCIVDQKDLDKQLSLLKKCPTITFNVSLPESEGTAKVEMTQTWIYSEKDL